MKSKVYHGVKGERITMVEKQNKNSNPLHCSNYEKQVKRDILDAVLIVLFMISIILTLVNFN